MSLGRFLVQTLRPDATIPSPHADGRDRRKNEQDGETKPALCPVHVGHDGFDLIGEEVGQTERQRDPEYGGTRVRHDELPERHARYARRQKRGGADRCVEWLSAHGDVLVRGGV